MYIFDSREKRNEHIKRYFQKHGIPFRTEALCCGDYMREGGTISVDRKKTLDELATNLMNPQDKMRFFRECRRAMEIGVRLVILCEHGKGIKGFQDLPEWRSKYSPVTGRALMEAIYRTSIAYGVTFVFCERRNTPKKILEILKEI